jgi:hypothetical protein
MKLTRRFVLSMLASAPLAPIESWGAWPMIVVHKDPLCDCCGGWVSYLEAQGFQTKIVEAKNINSVKARFGVPEDLWSCHTAWVGGYLLEGHVPATSVRKLLSERPKAHGLAVPGMPSGSPGMSGDPEEYEVTLFDVRKNVRSSYGKFKGDKEV